MSTSWTSLAGRTEWMASYAAGIIASLSGYARIGADIVARGGQLARPGRPTLYELLDVAPDADDPSVKAAYRALARRLHPDLNPGDAASAGRLAEINQAYAVLGDPAARAAYNRDLAQRRVDARRRWLAVAAAGGVTFAVTTTGLVSLAVWRHPAAAPGMTPPPVVTAALAPVSPLQIDNASLGDPKRAAIWETYRHPRFNFALRYPAGLFTLDAARSDVNVRTLVSRDGQATLRIVAAENTAGMTLADLRRALIKERYAGAQLKPAPRHQHWFALSGTRGKEVFLERITYSCDGKAMHGWQMLYPSSQRATYDEVAKLVLRNHPHGNGPPAACPPLKAQAKRQSRRERD